MSELYINARPESGKQFYIDFNNKGPVVMLNMLKFKPIADYSDLETLKPENEITGEEAYQLYMEHTLPLLENAGGKIMYYGRSNHFLIGPEAEKWDAILLVEHASVDSFMSFASDEAYLKIAGHRTAALQDSRLLPTTGISAS